MKGAGRAERRMTRSAPGPDPNTECVAEVPEPVSPTYRSRFREVSCSYPSQSVAHLPEQDLRGLARRERATGIEPAFSAWEADVLPLNYAREWSSHYPLPRT